MCDYEGHGMRPVHANVTKEGYTGICLRGTVAWHQKMTLIAVVFERSENSVWAVGLGRGKA